LSSILRKGAILRLFKTKVLREIIGEPSRWLNKEIYNFHTSLTVVVVALKLMGKDGLYTETHKESEKYEALKNAKGKIHLRRPRRRWRITIK
jgi:hypothetical protein